MSKTKQPFISLTSDFSPASEGVGVMKATIFKICPKAKVIDLSHGVKDFDIKQGANILEAVECLPVGFHVCVVDPGVGTKRKEIAIKTKRGDVLIGPDNGVLVPAAKALGGIKKIVSLTNEKYHQTPVSPIFHGRDIFCPAAAHLANGVKFASLGEIIKEKDITPAPYDFGKIQDGKILGEVIQVNKFGNLTINIKAELLKKINIDLRDKAEVRIGRLKLEIPYFETFGQVEQDKPLLMKDEYGKIEIALNCGNFAKKYQVDFGERVEISKV